MLLTHHSAFNSFAMSKVCKCLFALQVPFSAADCDASDQDLLLKRSKVCRSGVSSGCGPETLNVSADKDWPTQAVYMHDVLASIADPDTCLDTAFAQDTLSWLNSSQLNLEDGSSFMNTWDVFQVQYYDMPRLPGTRIEAPDTLGRKCWAMAYLKQTWEDGLGDQVKTATASSPPSGW